MLLWWPHLFLTEMKDSWWTLSGSLSFSFFCLFFPLFSFSSPPSPLPTLFILCPLGLTLSFWLSCQDVKTNCYCTVSRWSFWRAFLQTSHCNSHSIIKHTLVVSSLLLVLLCAVRYVTLLISLFFSHLMVFHLNFFCLFEAFLFCVSITHMAYWWVLKGNKCILDLQDCLLFNLTRMFRVLGKKIINSFTPLLQNQALIIAWNIILAKK